MRLIAREKEDSLAAVQARLLFRGLGTTRAELLAKIEARSKVKTNEIKTTESEYSSVSSTQKNINVAFDSNIAQQSKKEVNNN